VEGLEVGNSTTSALLLFLQTCLSLLTVRHLAVSSSTRWLENLSSIYGPLALQCDAGNTITHFIPTLSYLICRAFRHYCLRFTSCCCHAPFIPMQYRISCGSIFLFSCRFPTWAVLPVWAVIAASRLLPLDCGYTATTFPTVEPSTISTTLLPFFLHSFSSLFAPCLLECGSVT